MSLTDQEKIELLDLMETKPGFRNFLFRVIQKAGIFHATTNGSETRTFYENGRRSLGLEILREVEEAMPLQSPSGIPSLTVIQVLREEAQSPTPERTKRGRRSDPYTELTDGTDAEPGAE